MTERPMWESMTREQLRDEAVRQAQIGTGAMIEADRLRAAALAVDRAWGAWINHEKGEGFDAVVDAIGNLRATLEDSP